MRCLRGGRKGAESAAGGAEEMGWRLGWKVMGEGGVGQDGEWREGARKAEKGTRMKHAALASCGGGEGRAKWDLVRQGIPSCRRQAPVGLVVVGIVVGPVAEVRAFRDRAVLRPDQAVGRDAQFHDGAQRTIPGYDNGHKHHVAVRAVSAGRSNSRTPAEIS